MTIVNRKRVKEYALVYCKAKRPKFTRVSKSFIEMVDSQVRLFIRNYINSFPSVGKTIMGDKKEGK